MTTLRSFNYYFHRYIGVGRLAKHQKDEFTQPCYPHILCNFSQITMHNAINHIVHLVMIYCGFETAWSATIVNY